MKTGAQVSSYNLGECETNKSREEKKKADQLEELKLVLEAFIKFDCFFCLFRWEFEATCRADDGKEERGTQLIVMLNLRVNDTITMPTPAIAMETIFIASTD